MPLRCNLLWSLQFHQQPVPGLCVELTMESLCEQDANGKEGSGWVGGGGGQAGNPLPAMKDLGTSRGARGV